MLHETLKIELKSTFQDAEGYLKAKARDTELQEKLIVICRGFFPNESKSFSDVAQLLTNLNLGTRRLAVYMRSRRELLERALSSSAELNIFDEEDDLIDFIDNITY